MMQKSGQRLKFKVKQGVFEGLFLSIDRSFRRYRPSQRQQNAGRKGPTRNHARGNPVLPEKFRITRPCLHFLP